MYKQGSYLPSMSFYRGRVCIGLASWIRPTSKQGCYGVERYGRQLLQEHIVLAAYSVRTLDACGDTVYWVYAICCCIHAQRLTVCQAVYVSCSICCR